MAIRTLKKGSITTASKTTVFSVGVGNTASISNAVITNTSSSIIDVAVRVSDGSGNETLITSARLPAGAGKSKIVTEMIGGINSQSSISLQASTSTGFDYIIYGEVTNS